ncbi:MAG: TldD/PmbA family protein [Dehalococcoidales bacterium]|nr:TldD/PmbA family protein [Dehalococcoidales bacterium]
MSRGRPLVEKILARAKKVAEAAEVFTTSVEETSVQFETNRLKHVEGKQSTTIALRLIKNGRIGYALSSGENKDIDLVAMALETAEFGMPAKFAFPDETTFPEAEIYDEQVMQVTPEQMIKTGEGLISPLIANTPEIICQAGVGRGVVTLELMNSRGGHAKYNKTVFSLGVEGTVIHGTDMLFVGEGESSCRPITDIRYVVSETLRQLELAKTQASVPTKLMPVIFTPNGVANGLISPLIAAFNGKMVLEGASPIGKRLGETVFDTKLSLRDDATIAFRPESRPCDDEGVASRRIPLIEEGVVANFLYDLQTAALAGKESTGSGSRDRGLPSPSPSAFVIAPGTVSFDDMVRDMKEGLVIEQLMGAEQGNVLGGDFSGNVLLGFKVENGRIVGRVKDTMVSGNVYQLLKEITLGKEARWVGGFLQTPHFYFPSVSVASK